MGGVQGPHVFLAAVKRILVSHSKLHIILFGSKIGLTDYQLELQDLIQQRVSYVVCEQVVEPNDKPSKAFKHKKQSSMFRAVEAVALARADACVSGGNTGALMVIAYSLLKTISGIERPALVSTMPTNGKKSVLLLDLGANVQASPRVLLQYGLMGAVLAQQLGVSQQPKVALLNVGEEELKGNKLSEQSHQLMLKQTGFKYTGYIEGDAIFSGKADVVVTDGFTGNVALKSSEGIAQLLLTKLKLHFSQTWWRRLCGKLVLPILKSFYQRMNPDQYNGASLVGLRGIVVKSHSNASPEACYHAIMHALTEAEQSVPTKIKTIIESLLTEPN